MNQGSRCILLMKKTRAVKSRATVPLRWFFLERYVNYLIRFAANIKVRACLIFTPQLKLCEDVGSFQIVPFRLPLQ
jgi:hypothetical protein